MVKTKSITELQKKVLDCLAQGMKTKEIMDFCGCSESSVKQIRANRELRTHYDEACYDVVRGLVPKVVKELERLITDPNVQDSIKIAATKQILEISRISDVAGDGPKDFNITVTYE